MTASKARSAGAADKKKGSPSGEPKIFFHVLAAEAV